MNVHVSICREQKRKKHHVQENNRKTTLSYNQEQKQQDQTHYVLGNTKNPTVGSRGENSEVWYTRQKERCVTHVGKYCSFRSI